MFHVPKQTVSDKDNRFPSGSFMSKVIHNDLLHQQGMLELQKKNRERLIKAREVRVGNTKVIGARPVKNRVGFSGPGGVVLNNLETIKRYIDATEPQQVATAAHLRIGAVQSRGGGIGLLQSRVGRGGVGSLQSRLGGSGTNSNGFVRGRVQKTTGSIYRNKSVVLRGGGGKTDFDEEADDTSSILGGGGGTAGLDEEMDDTGSIYRNKSVVLRGGGIKRALDEEMDEYMGGNDSKTDLDKELEEYMAETAKITKMKKENDSKAKTETESISIADVDDEDDLFNIAIEKTLSEDIVFDVDELAGNSGKE